MIIRRYTDTEQLNCPKQSLLMGGQFPAKTLFQISQIQGISASIPSHSSHLSLFRGQNASGLTIVATLLRICYGFVGFKSLIFNTVADVADF
jgi:hypothetical protein